MTRRTSALSFIGLLAASFTVFAQAPAPGGTGPPPQGFTVQTLISRLSLFVPENLTQGGYQFGGRASMTGGQGTGAQGSSGQGQGGLAMQRAPFQFTRDPTLFLTRDQVAKLLPIVQGLKANPMPSPSKARQVEASVDAILTVAQKAEWDQFQKAMDKFRQSLRQQASEGGQQRMQQGGGPQLTQLQRRQRQVDGFLKALQDYQKQLGS